MTDLLIVRGQEPGVRDQAKQNGVDFLADS
jgi:hypothetical protein